MDTQTDDAEILQMRDRVEKAEALVNELRELCTLESDILRSMLCNADGECCITGTDADRRVVSECLNRLALAGGEKPKNDSLKIAL